MWRSHPDITLTSKKALATKIAEKGLDGLSPEEKAKSKEWVHDLSKILPIPDGDALLEHHHESRKFPAQPNIGGKTALMAKIRQRTPRESK